MSVTFETSQPAMSPYSDIADVSLVHHATMAARSWTAVSAMKVGGSGGGGGARGGGEGEGGGGEGGSGGTGGGG